MAAVLGVVAAWAGPAAGQVANDRVRPTVMDAGREPMGPVAPVVACFMPGTDPRYIERVEHYVALKNQAFFGPDYYLNGSWSGSLGTPRDLRWSFVPDGVSIPSGVGEPTAASNLFATLDSAYASQGGRAAWINRFQQVFDRWAALSGLTYTRIRFNNNDWDDGAGWGSAGSSTRGDVRIGMKLIDGGSGILAYNSYPQGGDMVLDSGDANLFASSSNQNRFLRNVVAHEHGHGIGLQHVCTNNSLILMEPFIDTSYDGPRQDDIRGAQRNYGDAVSPNSSFSTARALGALSMGTPIVLGPVPLPVTGSNDPNTSLLSIETTGRNDWYSFTFTQQMNVSVQVTPVGSTYDMAQQGSGCPASGSPMNALAVADLVVDVYDSNGTTLLATANSTGAGQSETTQAPLAGSGNRYIRVYAAGSVSSTQLYRITLTGISPCPLFTLQPQSQSQCAGPAILLAASAAGSPTPTYQWRKDQVDIPGANGPNYVINPSVPSRSGTYDVVATNSCGSTVSDPAVVEINSAPDITGHPQSQTIPLGSPVTFSVTLSNPSGMVYQWRKDSSAIPLANAPSYNIPSVTMQDEGTYDVLVIGTCGNAFSNAAVLTVGTACYANCDGSNIPPILNVSDFICFQQKFAAGDPYANCDGSTIPPVLNVSDFICFQQKFAQGCP